MHPALAIVLVMLGCCANVVTLELMTRIHPGCGNIVTCCQFMFIALQGFLFTMRCGKEPSKIPIREYVIMVVLFFTVSVMNNYALNFGIPMPLHMIFKSGSLVANLLMGMVVLKRFYPRFKYVAVVMITVGIILSTYASRTAKASAKERRQAAAAAGTTASSAGAGSSADGLDRDSTLTMAIGVFLLTAALLLSARLGIFQEVLYRTHGKHSQQALFFTHALPLPGFLLLASDIAHHAALFSRSEPMVLPPLPLAVPKMWVFLAGNVITQYVCISSVFRLTEMCTSLTVTLVITLRKFVSLLFSIWYFQNPFLREHWIGSLLVFAGTIIFTDPFGWFAPKTPLDSAGHAPMSSGAQDVISKKKED